MSDQTYKVILEGTIKEGVDHSEAVAQLAHLFRKDSRTIEKLLAGKPRIIRRHVDYPTALKYHKLMERAGAAARVEAEAEPLIKIVTEPLPVEDEDRLEEEAILCPRCGYKANKTDDVLRVRGDCPRCGLQVRKLDDLSDSLGTEADDDLTKDSDRAGAYGGMESASWERRAYAAMYTFALFLAFCFVFVTLSIFFLVPLSSIPEYLTQRFIEAAFTSFPTLTACVGIFVVLFLMPFAMSGRTWGQQAFGVQLFFTDEGQTGGLPLTLAFRAIAAGLVSFVPGLLLLRILSWWEIYPRWKSEWFLIGVAALLGWSVAWAHAVGRKDRRGLLDLAAGTVQMEEGLLPTNALSKACKPLVGIVALILFVGVILPYAIRLLTR